MPYYHVVFTLPAPAAEIAFQNKRAVYAILFRAAADAMRDIAADPRHLGAEIGAIAVLGSDVPEAIRLNLAGAGAVLIDQQRDLVEVILFFIRPHFVGLPFRHERAGLFAVVLSLPERDSWLVRKPARPSGAPPGLIRSSMISPGALLSSNVFSARWNSRMISPRSS